MVVGALLASALAPVTAGATTPITEYGPVPSSLPVGGVCEVEFDRSGALWVEQYLSSQVTRFAPVTHEVRMWSTPSSASYPFDINVHQPGAVWFGLLTTNKIGKLDIAAT